MRMQARDNRYYRETHDTFEQYCKERWNISRPRAYELMKAAEVHENLSAMADILSTNVDISERAIRPLTKLPPEEQREVYHEAVDTAADGLPSQILLNALAVPTYAGLMNEISKEYLP